MLEEHGLNKTYNEGDIIFAEGDEGEEMYILRKGAVEIYRNRDGNDVALATLESGEFFGEMALFGDKSRSASAKAIEESQVQIVDKETFASFIKEPVVWQVMDKMSQRIREVDDKLSNYWSKK